MKLYYNPRSRASIAKWLLDEFQVAYELVPIDFEKKEHKTPAFLEINPAGKLPALLDDGQKIFETVAIGLYLAEKYPEAGLAPPLGSAERGRFLSLMVFATSQLEPAMGDSLLKVETSVYRGWNDFANCEALIAQEIGEGPYLFGEQFTVADILIGSQFIWKRMFGAHDENPVVRDYVNRLRDRPHSVKMG
ncbi:MAG: glutathione S-transferase family protein [Candidatus Sericytochromatia bacterium]